MKSQNITSWRMIKKQPLNLRSFYYVESKFWPINQKNLLHNFCSPHLTLLNKRRCYLTSQKIIRKFAEFWTLRLLPLSSQDNNTLDYAVMGVLDSKVKATWHGSIDHLKLSFSLEWPHMTLVLINKRNKIFGGCVEALIEAEDWNLGKR